MDDALNWRDSTDEDGTLSLPHVALTPNLDVRTIAGNVLLSAEIKGPRVAGSTTRVDIRLPEYNRSERNAGAIKSNRLNQAQARHRWVAPLRATNDQREQITRDLPEAVGL